jgi:signal transduction histidine kinase
MEAALLVEQSAFASTEMSLADTWWKFLAEASLALEESLDYESTLSQVVRLGVPSIADFCTVALADEDGPITFVDAAHRDPAKAELVERLRGIAHVGFGDRDPLLQSIMNPAARHVPVIDEGYIEGFGSGPESRAFLRALAPTSAMFIPLVARDRVFGSLVFVATRESGRHYGEGEVFLAQEVARRAALAVDHARMFLEAVRAARMREHVLAVVSHDLKNPLNVIMMSAELLEEIIPDDADHQMQRDRVTAILRSARRMGRLTGDLLDMSALDAGRLQMDLEPLEPAEILFDIARTLEPMARAADVMLAVEADTTLPAVQADRDRLAQVLDNLIGNAIKFSPRGSRVLITAAPTDDAVEWRVTDCGPGIEPDALSHVFDRFWQAPGSRGGHGLGLGIARAIVEAHGGRIDVRSAPGEGATFTFTIPVADGAGSRRAPLVESNLNIQEASCRTSS